MEGGSGKSGRVIDVEHQSIPEMTPVSISVVKEVPLCEEATQEDINIRPAITKCTLEKGEGALPNNDVVNLDIDIQQ